MAKHESEKPAISLEDAVKASQEANNVQPVVQQSPLDLAAIDAMGVDELRILCKRMACQCGLIARMTQEETAQAMLDTLAETALKPIVMGLNMKADIQSRMTAIDKWLDRTKGKPMQSVTMDVNDVRMDKLPIDRLLRLASMLDEPVIIAPLPGKLDVDGNACG